MEMFRFIIVVFISNLPVQNIKTLGIFHFSQKRLGIPLDKYIRRILTYTLLKVHGLVSRSLLWKGPPLVKEGHFFPLGRPP